MNDTSREAFELKISMEYEQPPCIDRDGDGYADGYVDNAWWGWQSAQAEQDKLLAELVEAADALIDRWDSPLWKDLPHTAEYINKLRDVVDKTKKG